MAWAPSRASSAVPASKVTVRTWLLGVTVTVLPSSSASGVTTPLSAVAASVATRAEWATSASVSIWTVEPVRELSTLESTPPTVGSTSTVLCAE